MKISYMPDFLRDSHMNVREGISLLNLNQEIALLKELYRLSHTELEKVKSQVAKLLEQGFIRPSTSPWGSPVLSVNKEDGGLRFCFNYKVLNYLSVKKGYPYPRIDGLLDQVGAAQFSSVIGLCSGYQQVHVASEYIHKTAFSARYGLFEFFVVSLSLTSSLLPSQTQ